MLLQGLLVIEDNRGIEEETMFDLLWKSSATSKAIAFLWKFLLDRIPSRQKSSGAKSSYSERLTNVCVLKWLLGSVLTSFPPLQSSI
jgi:hypothetical protein